MFRTVAHGLRGVNEMEGTLLEEDGLWRRAISAILNGTKKPGLGRYPVPACYMENQTVIAG